MEQIFFNMLVYFIQQKHGNYKKQRDQTRQDETITHKPTHDFIIYQQIFKKNDPNLEALWGVGAHGKLI